VTSLDVASFGVGVLLIAVVVSVAASLPARRAARLDPVTALRE
jgi:ABC-type antimicrobial peptide transport system permease subunit